MPRTVTGAEAVQGAIVAVMRANDKAVTYGLGVNDPGKVFGTTHGLLEEFSASRVFETPTSELAMTGVGVGLAIAGHPVIHSHQRMDFALLAMDQLVNSAAKWKFMFGDQFSVPYLTRMIIGRGWGQGPTHSQNLESWLAHVPGIRVLVPATPQDLNDSIRAIENTEDPIVVIEHRWIHGVVGEVSQAAPLTKILSPVFHSPAPRADLTIVTWGLATFDCLAAQKRLGADGVHADVIQLRELTIENFEDLIESLSNSGRLLVVSNSWGPGSFGDTVSAYVSKHFSKEDQSVKMSSVSYSHSPEPTSLNQLNAFHVSDWRVANGALELLGRKNRFPAEAPVDQPQGYDFGPF
jgi:acetoin:2,6-dichlorophenolindophenol oxidoreductase subunit beta